MEYSFDVKQLFKRIQNVRDDLEYNKNRLKKKRENEYERIRCKNTQSS
jgi:hypothetical protein